MRIDLSSIVGRMNAKNDIKNKAKAKAANYAKMPAKGETVKGQITDLQLNKVNVLLDDGKLVEAKMTEQFSFNIGDQLTFHVKESSEEVLLLQPLLDENMSEGKMLDILKAAGLKETPKNLEILTKLIENNLPIDKKSLTEMSMFSKRFPSATVDELVFLTKNDIMISKDSLRYANELLNHKQSMSKNITSFNSNVANIVDKASGALVVETILKENEPATNVFTKIRNFFLRPTEQVEVPKEKLDFPMNKVMEQVDADSIIRATGKQVKEGDKSVSNSPFGQAALKGAQASEQMNEFLGNKGKAFSDLFSTVENLDIPDDIKQATNRLLAQRVTKSMLNNELMMHKEDLASVDKINKHYNKVYDRIMDVLSLDIQDTSEQVQDVLKEAGNIKTNMDMMNQLQDNHQFVHLPVVINDQNVESELYIMNNKGNKKSSEQRITALLRLDLRNLGSLDIYVAKTAKNVEVNFYTEGDDIMDHIRNHSSALVNQLIEKSFNVLGVGVMMREKEFDIVEDFINAADNSDSKRFSFDMRA